MRSKFAFLALLTMIRDKCWCVNAVHNSSSEDCSAKMVVCNCNVNQDAHFTEALSALEAKLDKLMALMNITSPPPPQPTQPPGERLEITLVFVLSFFFSSLKSLKHQRVWDDPHQFFFISVVQISSCKEQYDRDKWVQIFCIFPRNLVSKVFVSSN